MCQNQFYIAIDLGTTNSVIARANFSNGRLVPCVLDIPRKNETGSTSRDKLLPSVVYYSKNRSGEMSADVGNYAKSRYGIKNNYVCKSVKSLMVVPNRFLLQAKLKIKLRRTYPPRF